MGSREWAVVNRDKCRAYCRAWYSKNKERERERSRDTNQKYADSHRGRRKQNKDYILHYKLHHACIDCGEPDPIVLDFDHRDRATKLGAVATMAGQGVSLDRLVSEIAKCDIRCANCHRRKTLRENRNALRNRS